MAVLKLKTKSLSRLPFNMCQGLGRTRILCLQAGRRPILQSLRRRKLACRSFSRVCRGRRGFRRICRRVYRFLLRRTLTGRVACKIPKRPLITRHAMRLLVRHTPRENVRVVVRKKRDFLSPLFRTLGVSPVRKFRLLSKASLGESRVRITRRIVVKRICSRFITDSIGLALVRGLPCSCTICVMATTNDGSRIVGRMRLRRLSRGVRLGGLASMCIPPMGGSTILCGSFSGLQDVVTRLQKPGKYP